MLRTLKTVAVVPGGWRGWEKEGESEEGKGKGEKGSV